MTKTIACAFLMTVLALALSASIETVPSNEVEELVVEVRKAGDCDQASKADIGKKLTIQYEGSLEANNKVFDSSKARNEPMSFTLGKGEVIEGWDQGLMGMCPGEERTLIVPPSLAYGSKGFGEVIPPDSTLVFEVILLEVN